MRVLAAVLCALSMMGCSAARGPLLHSVASADGGSDPSPADASAPSTAITQSMSWQYQLSGEIDPDVDATLFVIDLFEPETALIEEMHAQGKVVVAYLSAGTFEPFRPDADEFPAGAIGESLVAYPNEAWLDIRDATVRRLMAARLDVARDKDFDGIVPTCLTAYLESSGFELSAADQRDYTQWLAQEAHARGLHVGMSGDFGQAAQLALLFDWAVHFGCIARDDCDALALLVEQGKPVFDVETDGEAADVCARAAELGVNALLKRPQLDAYRVGCQ